MLPFLNRLLQSSPLHYLKTTLSGICCCCGLDSDTSTALCSHCLKYLPKISNPCLCCGVSLGTELPSGIIHCQRCQDSPPAFDRCRGAFAYLPPVDRLVSDFKFNERTDIGAALSTQLAVQINAATTPRRKGGAIIAVPLHPRRLLKRGFNQAGEIAKKLCRHTGFANLSHLVIRQKNTIPQTEMKDAVERKKNLVGAFILKKPELLAAQPRIILVDDVVTTGATVSEISKILRAAGVAKIEVWCLARAGRER